jgi:hypothetical protein
MVEPSFRFARSLCSGAVGRQLELRVG